MNVRVEFFNKDSHYEFLTGWWKDQSWPVIPLSHLPSIGFISFINDTPAVAGFLYQTDSAFCLFEWIVANPKVRRAERAEGFSALFEMVKEAAKEMGFKTIFVSSKNLSLVSRLEKSGFTANESSMTNLTYLIKGDSNG